MKETGAGLIANILVIEDPRVERFLMTRTLEGAGYAVQTAATCQEAVEKCRQRRFDAITLDLLLPDGPGWEALGRIRSMKHHRNTPVIVVSKLEANDLQMIPQQVQGLFMKPVGADDLLGALERAGLPMRAVKVLR